MTTLTPEQLEQDMLELLFLEDVGGPKCGDWSRIGCKNDASCFLVCPCNEGRAAMCDSCFAKGKERCRPRFFGLIQPMVWFDRSCKHMVRFSECSVQPI